jgi:hypothetical protein
MRLGRRAADLEFAMPGVMRSVGQTVVHRSGHRLDSILWDSSQDNRRDFLTGEVGDHGNILADVRYGESPQLASYRLHRRPKLATDELFRVKPNRHPSFWLGLLRLGRAVSMKTEDREVAHVVMD